MATNIQLNFLGCFVIGACSMASSKLQTYPFSSKYMALNLALGMPIQECLLYLFLLLPCAFPWGFLSAMAGFWIRCVWVCLLDNVAKCIWKAGIHAAQSLTSEWLRISVSQIKMLMMLECKFLLTFSSRVIVDINNNSGSNNILPFPMAAMAKKFSPAN